MKILVLLLVTVSGMCFALSAMDMALEGAALVEKSEGAWFPFNLIFFYTGLMELQKAIDRSPNDLHIRLIRISALFDHIDNPLALEIVKQDLEYLIAMQELWDEDLNSERTRIYFMMVWVYAKAGNSELAKVYMKKLSLMAGSKPYIELLENNFKALSGEKR